MNPHDLTSQEGMEGVFRRFCSNWPEEQKSRVSALCSPQFAGCSYASKTLSLRYYVQEWMRNYADIMHGGIVCTVFDITMGLLSCYCTGGLLAPTTNLQVSFLRPIPAGKTLVVEARCDMAGKTLCSATARAYMEGAPEKPVATGSATFYSGNAAQAVGLFK